MKKQKQGRIFGRPKNQRRSLLNSLAGSIFLKERITTTEAKAKELKRFAEKCITKAKKGDLSSRRSLSRYLPDKIVKKLIEEIAPRYKTRDGGYTRIIRLGQRKTDGAKITIIELVK